jgi:K(+)-stimulated pyrophosphate-energized sodium pump
VGTTTFEFLALWGVLLIALIGLAYALLLRLQVMREPKGTAKMQEVWNYIRIGADAYLDRQLRTILPLIFILTFVLFFSVYIVPPTAEALQRFSMFDPGTVRLIIGLGRAAAFILGALFSLIVGQFGMRMAVQGNVRVAAAASRSFSDSLRIAYRTGTITGMLTDGLGLLGGTTIFMIFGVASPDVLLGFGFGGTLLALFMRVGGGIYTKAADVGADLVGKVEQGIPEDDPRNAAVIADLVGDNVGDCAGMAADIFESYEVTIVSSLILGLALVTLTHELKWIIFPLLVRGIGVFSSIIGTYLVKGKKDQKRGNALTYINRGFYTSAGISVVGFFFLAVYYMHEWRAFLSVVIGILLVIVINELTKYFTDSHYQPVEEIAAASQTGGATIILHGLAVGYEAAVWQIAVISAAILAAIVIYNGQPMAYVLYGISLTGIGMLTLTGNNLAMDSFGPISDNANGIGEMADLDENSREVLSGLDEVGNTTKAVTKGVAIGSAVIAAVSLFGSFVTSVSASLGHAVLSRPVEAGIHLSDPLVFVGLMLGASIPWLFSSFCISSVARAATLIVEEVRRQFRIPGLLEGKVLPDYKKPIEISTIWAQKELISLALIAIMTPLLAGMVLSAEALGGFLVGAIISGQLLAVFMVTAGGAWDNAKKTIEKGLYGGKGSDAHKASVIGDTVGDPLKDTAGPALNPMIKVINLVSLIAAPIIIHYHREDPQMIVAIIFCLVVLFFSIIYSKYGSFKNIFARG